MHDEPLALVSFWPARGQDVAKAVLCARVAETHVGLCPLDDILCSCMYRIIDGEVQAHVPYAFKSAVFT